jgi:hypothetical protein
MLDRWSGWSLVECLDSFGHAGVMRIDGLCGCQPVTCLTVIPEGAVAHAEPVQRAEVTRIAPVAFLEQLDRCDDIASLSTGECFGIARRIEVLRVIAGLFKGVPWAWGSSWLPHGLDGCGGCMTERRQMLPILEKLACIFRYTSLRGLRVNGRFCVSGSWCHDWCSLAGRAGGAAAASILMPASTSHASLSPVVPVQATKRPL